MSKSSLRTFYFIDYHVEGLKYFNYISNWRDDRFYFGINSLKSSNILFLFHIRGLAFCLWSSKILPPNFRIRLKRGTRGNRFTCLTLNSSLKTGKTVHLGRHFSKHYSLLSREHFRQKWGKLRLTNFFGREGALTS